MQVKGVKRNMSDPTQAAKIVAEVKKAVVGKDAVVVKVLLALLAGGHVLLEDIPGVGKTTLALAFSRALGLRCQRVQFTPDVMPSDITGFSLYNKASGQMEYQPGAVLCNLFLADELNRATLALTAACRAMAYLNRRDYVVPGDVEYLFHDVVAHRLLLAPKTDPAQREPLLRALFQSVRAPRIR